MKKRFKAIIEWKGKGIMNEILMEDAINQGLEEMLGKEEKAKVIEIEEIVE